MSTPHLSGPFPVYVIEWDEPPPGPQQQVMSFPTTSPATEDIAIAAARALYDHDWQDDPNKPATVRVVKYDLQPPPPPVLLELGPRPVQIYRIEPNEGPADPGSRWCQIFGFRLREVTGPPTFGGIPAPQWSLNPGSTIDCLPPSHAPGRVDVAVATEDSRAELTGGYTYT